jgi:hypothetical protein
MFGSHHHRSGEKLCFEWGRLALLAGLLGVGAGWLTATPARAQAGPPDLSSQPLTFSAQHQLFQDLHVDTGYLPEGAPVQLRFRFDVGGGFSVSAGAEAWTDPEAPLEVALRGIAGSGRYEMNLGPQIELLARLHVTVAGRDIDWEGPIPLPLGFPSSTDIDFRFAASQTFDPFLLDGQSVQVSDRIEDTVVLDIPLTEELIPVPGIGGSLRLKLGGELSSEFRGVSAGINDVAAGLDDAGLDRIGHAHYAGRSTTTGTLILTPALHLGIGPFSHDFELAVPVALPGIDTDWDLGTPEFALSAPAPASGTGGTGTTGAAADSASARPGPGTAPEAAASSASGCHLARGSASLPPTPAATLLLLGPALAAFLARRRRRA